MKIASRTRAAAAAACLTLITLLFLDFTGTMPLHAGWLARIQPVPALLAANVAAIVALVAVTLLFGRVHCAVLCPLGILQDAVSRASRRFAKRRFAFRPATAALRYGLLVLFALLLAGGAGHLVALLEPYSIYGRIAANLMAPVYRAGDNLLAAAAERLDSYAFYAVDVWRGTPSTLAISALFLSALVVLAWRSGRLWCNTICPVGTALGLLSRHALVRPRIDGDACNRCGACARGCRSSCIDAASGTIDPTRCVMCLECAEICPQGGIRFTPDRREGPKMFNMEENASKSMDEATGKEGLTRRTFLSSAGLLIASAATAAHAKQFDGGLAKLEARHPVPRETPVLPPGAQGARHFAAKCTACHLCVSGCPNEVLRPSANLTPEMTFERGYCRPECTRCSSVCPNGAIRPVTVAEKSSLQVGIAVWNSGLCLVRTMKVSCTSCARHCPAGAIVMTPQDPADPASLKIPVVDPARCIGCGACEHLCPARPEPAIHVEGTERHRFI